MRADRLQRSESSLIAVRSHLWQPMYWNSMKPWNGLRWWSNYWPARNNERLPFALFFEPCFQSGSPEEPPPLPPSRTRNCPSAQRRGEPMKPDERILPQRCFLFPDPKHNESVQRQKAGPGLLCAGRFPQACEPWIGPPQPAEESHQPIAERAARGPRAQNDSWLALKWNSSRIAFCLMPLSNRQLFF